MSSSRSTFVRAFLSSALGTGLSRVLGAARDVALAGFLGAGSEADAFRIAFTIPQTFRHFVADEGLTGALVPAIAQAEAADGTASARRLASAAFTALMGVSIGLCVAGMLGAEVLVTAFAPSWRDDPAQFDLAVRLTRWLMPFLAMVSAVSFLEGLLNHRGHFLIPKVAPGLVSAGMVASIVWLGDVVDPPVMAVVYGTLVGGVVHVLVNVPPLLSRWGALWPVVQSRSPRMRSLIQELGKVALIGLMGQVNLLVLRQIATSLETGAVTHYESANRLVDLAQGIVAVAIGSALLPAVAKRVVAEDWDGFRDDLVRAFRLAGFLLLPTAAALVGFAVPFTAILFRHGRFTAEDVAATAATLVYFTPFMLAVASVNIVKKVYFALDDRNTLLGVGAFGVAATGVIGWGLTSAFGVSGLSAALSVSTVLQLTVYVVILHRRLGDRLGVGRLVGPWARMAVASAPIVPLLLAIGRYGAWERGPLDARNVAVFAVGAAVAGVAYATASWLLGVEELSSVVRRLRGRFGR